MSSIEKINTGPRYWRSLDELAERPEFQEWVEREFPQGASELDGVNRRNFLRIMAASFAFAGMGMAGCRRPEQNILPYSKQPENMIPGVPVYYATSQPKASEHIPLVVETHQARPTKVEGNNLYDPYAGSTDIFAQASVLDLYDQDRAQTSRRGSKRYSSGQVKDLLNRISNLYKATGGQGLAILGEENSSPTYKRLKSLLQQKYPRIMWAEYEPVSSANLDNSLTTLTGQRLRPVLNLDQADRIVSLEADFLHKEPGSLGNARAFGRRRRIHKPEDADYMNRLYQVESDFSVTGTMADHRLRMASGNIPAFAALLASSLLEKLSVNSPLITRLKNQASRLSVPAHWIEECVNDLIKNKSNSVILAGSHQPPVVHQLTYVMNSILGSVGQTVNYVTLPDDKTAGINDLVQAMEARRVETLFILGGNPVYNTPGDLNFAQVIKDKKVREVIRLGYNNDETSDLANVHIAATHYLESWGDGRTWDGTLVTVQPMIMPLFEGMQDIELLARLAGLENPDPYSLVKETFATFWRDRDQDKAFNLFLHDGLLPGTLHSVSNPVIDWNRFKLDSASMDTLTPVNTGKDNLEIRLIADNSVWDGRYNNNGWLQECPDPMTKLTWDNAILISPKLAQECGYDFKSGEFFFGLVDGVVKNNAEFKQGNQKAAMGVIKLANGSRLNAPIHVQPGLADYTVILPLGFGRQKVGRVGSGTGKSFYPLMPVEGMAVQGGTLEVSESKTPLANTQEHWSMEGRAIIREGRVDDFVGHPDFVSKMGMESHSPPVYGRDKKMPLKEKVATQPRGNSLYETPTFKGREDWQISPHQWGMSIDLNTCLGCNACVIACQSENNIPIVGKDQVLRGREMHWIRLDRYYSSGDLEANQNEIPSDPQVSLMPMLCQQCEMAPCEQVCPVNATVHDEQGLNVMAYNRCVGTRYCANNCPYKVRRFNFFDWNKRSSDHFYEGPLGPVKTTELQKMQKNPDVTVRMRGVMEKCTFCQQRIEEGKIAQKRAAGGSDNIEIPDGTIKTACQQVCPTGAIAFGNLLDENSKVSKLKASPLDYSVLGYLNTRPRTTYLARLRNPNKAMPDFYEQPYSQKEYEDKAHGGSDHGIGHKEAAAADAHGGGH